MIEANYIQTRPIVTWPGHMTPANERKGPRYKIKAQTTRTLLLEELYRLDATDVFIQAAYRDDQIRMDGLPRIGAIPTHPGVILTYNINRIPYQLPCDTFRSSEQNLRAIVLTLQRLRLIEETGVKTHGRQYQGFKQLTGDESPAEVLAEWSKYDADAIRCNSIIQRNAYREACKKTHPDLGGDAQEFIRVTRAGELLGL